MTIVYKDIPYRLPLWLLTELVILSPKFHLSHSSLLDIGLYNTQYDTNV